MDEQLDGALDRALLGLLLGRRLLALRVLVLGAAPAATATPAATAPAGGTLLALLLVVRLVGVGVLGRLGLGVGLSLGLGLHIGLGGLPAVALLAGEDGVHEVGLAETAEAVEAELRGDGVEVGKRAGLQGGAIEHGHAGPFG